MDEDTCMVDVAKYFCHLPGASPAVSVPSAGSAPKTAGNSRADYPRGGYQLRFDLIQRLAEAIKVGSMCGLDRQYPTQSHHNEVFCRRIPSPYRRGLLPS